LHKLRSKHIFSENSKKMKFQPKRGFEKPCFRKIVNYGYYMGNS
jgi:hypothetical protein